MQHLYIHKISLVVQLCQTEFIGSLTMLWSNFIVVQLYFSPSYQWQCFKTRLAVFQLILYFYWSINKYYRVYQWCRNRGLWNMLLNFCFCETYVPPSRKLHTLSSRLDTSWKVSLTICCWTSSCFKKRRKKIVRPQIDIHELIYY